MGDLVVNIHGHFPQLNHKRLTWMRGILFLIRTKNYVRISGYDYKVTKIAH